MSLQSAAQSILSGAEILTKSPNKAVRISMNEAPGSMGLASPPQHNIPIGIGEFNKTDSSLAATNPYGTLDNAPRINDTESEYKDKDPRQTFSWFKKHMSQILEAYERTISNASSIDSAEIQVVAFGRLLITKMIDIFPNLKDEILGPTIEANSPKKADRDEIVSLRDSQTFKPNSSGLRQIGEEADIQKLLNRQNQQLQESFADQGKAQQRLLDDQSKSHQRMMDAVGTNIERLDYKMERLTQSVARSSMQQSPAAQITPIKQSPFKIGNPKFDSQMSQIDQTAALRNSQMRQTSPMGHQQEEPPNIFTSRTQATHVNGMPPQTAEKRRFGMGQSSGGYTPSISLQQSAEQVSPLKRLTSQTSSIMGAAEETIIGDMAMSPGGEGMGNDEYFQRREHDKLHEKLDFIVSQLARVDRNVKCLALTDGANLALQTMMDASQLSDFEKLRRNTLPPRSESKCLLKISGTKTVHLIPVINQGYQFVIVNNMHEALVYKDYFGAIPEENETSDVQAEPTGTLQLIARVPVPQMSCCLVANETLVIGTNIKMGWLQSFDLQTFEKTATSSAMLSQAVTCMCQGEDSGTILVGMSNSYIACVRAGRAYLEVIGQFSLGPAVKTFHSICKTTRGDFAIGTMSGICFVKWNSMERNFIVIKQTPTSTTGPPLALLNNRQTLSIREVAEDLFMTSDYNQPGYYIVNRATKDVKKLEEVISDNRGCFDIQPLPNFHVTDAPFVLFKARKGVVLSNVNTLDTFELLRTPEMQGDSLIQKMTVARKKLPPGRQILNNKVDLVVTHVEWSEGRTIVEQLELPELFLRALSLNGEI